MTHPPLAPEKHMADDAIRETDLTSMDVMSGQAMALAATALASMGRIEAAMAAYTASVRRADADRERQRTAAANVLAIAIGASLDAYREGRDTLTGADDQADDD
jgi:hypothetical protein